MISVIIPVFNTGNPLNRCLNSVVNQTYKDLDIILVNDCSTDKKTIQIINEWVDKDARIRLIEKRVNEGVDMARYSAIQQVKGDYISFVDSDDWLEKDALSSMIDVSNETDADVVIGKMRKVYWRGVIKRDNPYREKWMNRLICHEELMSEFYISYFGVNILPVNLCAVLFRTSIVLKSNVKPSGMKFGEDLLMSMQIFPHINTLYAINKIVYNYNVGLPSISDKYLDNWLENARKLYEIKMHTLIEMRYDKALFYQKVELVNFLKFYVYGCCTRRRNDRNKSIALLENEIQNPIYRQLVDLINSKYKDKTSVSYLVNCDATNFYLYIEKDVMDCRKNPKVYFLSFLTNVFRFF